MRRIYILFLAVACIFSSCDSLSKKIVGKEIDKIDEAKTEALGTIDEASSKAVLTAEMSISEATKEAIANVNQDLNNAIKEAEKSIASSVKTEITKTITEERTQTEKKIRDVYKVLLALLVVSVVALITAIVAIVFLSKQSHSTVNHSDIQHMISCKIYNAIETEVKPKMQSFVRTDDLASEFKKLINKTDMRRYMAGDLQTPNNVASNKQNFFTGIGQSQPSQECPTTQQVHQELIASHTQKVELFARDSREMVLTGATTNYQPGKSIFKLVLDSSESSIADIAICTDKPEVLQRIIQSDQDLIEPVCRIESTVNRPTDVKWTPGKAEKVSADTWKVIKQVIVNIV